MLTILYRCPVDQFPLLLAPNGGGYFCAACPPDWGPGQGIDKDRASASLLKGYPLQQNGERPWRRRGVRVYAPRLRGR